MNIPEQPSPPQEELLERALRYACEQRAYRYADERAPDHTHADASEDWYQVCLSIARIGLERAAAQRWTVTETGRAYLRDYPLSPEEAP